MRLKIVSVLRNLAIVLMFCMLLTGISACGNKYDDLTLTLSNNNEEITVYLDESGVSNSVVVEATVQGSSEVDKRVSVTCDGDDYLNIESEFNGKNTTFITITGTNTCRRQVVVRTIEGSKVQSFYVNVINPVRSITPLADTSIPYKFYAIRGTQTELVGPKFIKYNPSDTSQKEIDFSLVNPVATASIKNNILTISQEYPSDTIAVRATSKHDLTIQTTFNLQVINQINQNTINFSACYAETEEVIDLANEIKIANNDERKQYVKITMVVDAVGVEADPYIKSSMSSSSNALIFSKVDCEESLTSTTFAFYLSSLDSEITTEQIYFVVKYKQYDYSYITKYFDISLYDAINELRFIIDGNESGATRHTVYNTYVGVKGLKILTNALPATISADQKELILTKLTGANNFTFFDKNGNEIIFTGSSFTFMSGDVIYVSAKAANVQNGKISISSVTNPSISKEFEFVAAAGTETITFTNQIVNSDNSERYYLSSNYACEQTVKFTINTGAIDTLKIRSIATSFEIDDNIVPSEDGKLNEYQFKIKSIKDAVPQTELLVIEQANGCTAEIFVEVFRELDENNISFSAPNVQSSTSVGKMTSIAHLKNLYEKSAGLNLEFNVSIKNGNAVSLTKQLLGASYVDYSFYDYVYDLETVTKTDYDSFLETSLYNGFEEMEFMPESNILNKLFLISYDQILGNTVGKTWVKAMVGGYSATKDAEGTWYKETINYDFYFLVEIYNPITTFALSSDVVNVFSKNSVSYEEYGSTIADVNLIINSNATYQDITWFSARTSSNVVSTDEYVVNGEPVYIFENLGKSVHISAFSTYQPYDSLGEISYREVPSLTYYFVAQVQEFNITYVVELKVTITHAQQVEKIIVTNVSLDSGVYIPLTFDGNIIERQILADVQIGESGVEARNQKLVYVFEPYGDTRSDMITLNKDTGLITISGELTVGGSGIIKIIPADRFIASGVYENADDVIVSIKITVADGRSRDTSYRIASLSEITNFVINVKDVNRKYSLHYTLLGNDQINTTICEEFNGGLYGSIENDTNYSTIRTTVPLFNKISTGAIVADLILEGDVSACGFVAIQNSGTINNVAVEISTSTGEYLPSTVTAGEDSEFVGGLVAENLGTIKNSAFYGRITAIYNSLVRIGGIAGVNKGTIENCNVEFYNFSNDIYGGIQGGAESYIGGIVGEVASGRVENCSVYSFVSKTTGGGTDYISFNVLTAGDGPKIGVIAGVARNGSVVDNCYGYANTVQTLIGQDEGENTTNNGFVIYRTTNDSLLGNYTYNGQKNYNPNDIVSDNVWTRQEIINNNLPYFVNSPIVSPLQNIPTIFSEMDNVISGVEKAIAFFYKCNGSLNTQENIAINRMNLLPFMDLFNVYDAVGIRAIVVDGSQNVISTLSNGLSVNGLGQVQVKFFSKYDYSTSRIFTIYTIYPIADFTLYKQGIQFNKNSSIDVKITDGFVFNAEVNDKIVLDKNPQILELNNLQMDFVNVESENNYSDFIIGNNLGLFTIKTVKLAELTNTAKIGFTIYVAGLPFSDDDDFNALIKQQFGGYFTINLYSGADKLEISTSRVEIEPIDETTIEVSILSDRKITLDETTEDVLFAVSEDSSISEDMLDISSVLVKTIYYTDSTMKEEITNSENFADAKYFKHVYALTVKLKDAYRGGQFVGDTIKLFVFAKSSQDNLKYSNTELVGEYFYITVSSQNLLSITINHKNVLNKSLEYNPVTQNNVVLYEYHTNPTGVVAPGDEGVLEINFYPNFARYDDVEITYVALNEQSYDLSFALMTKRSDGKFYYSTRNCEQIDNGIRINNVYEYDSSNSSALSTLYIGTYLSSAVMKDTVFVITVATYRDGKVVASNIYNLIAQYVDGAEIKVLDENDKEVDAVVRGDTKKLVIKVKRNQTLNLESIVFNGIKQTANMGQNYISYSSFQVTEEGSDRIYTANLYIGRDLTIINNANYITIEATISWIINGKLQQKTTSYFLSVVDFKIENIQLLTDFADKTNFVGYIGVQTTMQFDFGNKNKSENQSFQRFLNNYYFESVSQNNRFGDYKVNYGSNSNDSFIGNLYYENGTKVFNDDGSIEENAYFSIIVEKGVIKIIGKRTTQDNPIKMKFKLPVQIPNLTSMLEKEIVFDFTITITTYSDEDTPKIIDNDQTFLDAVSSAEKQNYILMADLYLYNYAPLSTTGIASLDGNNYTINIMSWSYTDTNTLSLALFNEITQGTTLKNITVNIYHASEIYVNTDIYTNTNIAGFGITNNGIIYNCAVVAYKADLTKSNVSNPGLNVAYSCGTITSNMKSQIAGFVISNNGYITNSRVGGTTHYIVRTGTQVLSTFNISGQGDLSGFAISNSKYIASSYFSNGTISNNTISLDTSTSGFVKNNSGQINTSYVKGTGLSGYSYTGAGISSSSISSGFVYSNTGSIGDCYSNILLAITDNGESSGRLSAGFVYSNYATIERCYTASKIQDAKSTQMAFVGIDSKGNLLNTGRITYSYYYSEETIKGDAYANTSSNVNIVRITSPEDNELYYGFSFADDSGSINGVWYITQHGVELVSANQIAISSRYIANEQRDENGNLQSYNLPYVSGYEYGSTKNPIIIRSAKEFNMVFGGDDLNAGTAISRYYNLSNKTITGNYRLITDIDLLDLSTDSSTGIKVNTTIMTLNGAVIDGNMLTITNIGLTSSNEGENAQSFGLFQKMINDSVVMNLKAVITSVSALQVKYVGSVVGHVIDSKLININIVNDAKAQFASILGNHIVGGLAGVVQGDCEIKNINISNIHVTTQYVSNTTQNFNRNINNTNDANNTVSYAGGIVGVADVYSDLNKENTYHLTDMVTPQLSNLIVNGHTQIFGSTVGGLVGYLGPQTYMKDLTFELNDEATQKLIANKFYAGGIVGECYGDIDMARAQHDAETQKIIENNISTYYADPSKQVNRGNLDLFEEKSENNNNVQNKPIAIGGLVGCLQTGNIKHSYSKINVRHSEVQFAGGIVGMIPYVVGFDRERNTVLFYEVYAFGDVCASTDPYKSAGAGGIAGYIQDDRILIFTKVNAVNYYSLVYNSETKEYSLPSNIYQMFAKTGSSIDYANSVYIDKLANYANNITTMKTPHTESELPIISSVMGSSYLCALDRIEYVQDRVIKTINIKKSYARLSTNSIYTMIFDQKQIITPFYEFNIPENNGNEMDTYFDTWDNNFWIRYTKTYDLLPSLVTYSESNVFYIDVASDLQYMIYYPNATFIVRANNKEPYIVKVGDYLRQTGLKLTNFTGTLKGFDDSTKYGLDFEGYYSFIENSANAKFYNLTIKNIGYDLAEEKTYTESTTAFVGNAVSTSFENLLFKNCQVYAIATENNVNFGIMANKLTGGYVSNISFDSCYMDVRAETNTDQLNVGMLCGMAETMSNSYMQIFDVCEYQSGMSSFKNSLLSETNSIVVNSNNKTIKELNVGAVAGQTAGSVMSGYTSVTYDKDKNEIKNVGIISNTKNKFTPDTISSVNSEGTSGLGTIIALKGAGLIDTYNAGMIFGQVNTLNWSSARSGSYQKVYVVGAITQTTENGVAIVNTANLGGMIGNVATSIVLSSSTSSEVSDSYVEVDVDIQFKALRSNAGMLLGLSANTNSVNNIDTYGTINITNSAQVIEGTTKSYSSKLGGMIGSANGVLSIINSACHTPVNFTEINEVYQNNMSYLGGFVGYFNSSDSSLIIGSTDFDTEYLGEIIYSGSQQVGIGGIIGGINSVAVSGGDEVSVFITGAVFGGNIKIKKAQELYVGGIVGLTTAKNSTAGKTCILNDNLSYGNINIDCDLAQNENDNLSFVGGIIGRGSSTTYLQQNYAIASIVSNTSQTIDKCIVNAIAGTANGAQSGTDEERSTNNYYCHQLTLCLDANMVDNTEGKSPFNAQNIYYKNPALDRLELPTMNSVLRGYRDRLAERYTENYIQEYYTGTKLYPIEIAVASDYAKVTNNSLERKYFLLLNDTNADEEFYVENLASCHILGDGYGVWNSTSSVFGVIDENSVVTGLRLNAEIAASTAHTVLGLSGCGALADINQGVIYSCSVVEQKPLSTSATFGLKASSASFVGGVAGVNFGQILDTMSGIDIESSAVTGGFVGYNCGLISNSYSTGNIKSENAYGFCNGSGDSRIYYCYTASPSATVKGVFAGSTEPKEISQCYSDVYACGADDSYTYISDTKTMSMEVGSEGTSKDNFLLDHSDLTITSNAYKTIKMKFGYDSTHNFGYLAFCGTAYKNFDYLQNLNTGDGTKENPILLHCVGKLQQINLSLLYMKGDGYCYNIINDIEITEGMFEVYDDKNSIDLWCANDESFHVIDWAPIGGSVSNNPFVGSITADIEGTIYTIKNVYDHIAKNQQIASLFGETVSASIYSINVEYEELEFGATSSSSITTFSGLVNSASKTEIKFIELNIGNLTSSSVENVAGVLITCDDSENPNTIQNVNITYAEIKTSNKPLNYGGIILYADCSTIKDCEVETVSIEAESANLVGGMVGESDLVNILNVNVKEVNVKLTSSSSDLSVGGAIANGDGNVSSATVTKVDVDATQTGVVNIGGLIGSAKVQEAGDNVNINDSSTAVTVNLGQGSGKVCIGGAVGSGNVNIDNVSVSSFSATTTNSTNCYVGGALGSGDSEFDGVHCSGVTITSNGEGQNFLGGLIGESTKATFVGETSTVGAVKITTQGGECENSYLGGVAGKCGGEIDDVDVSSVTLTNKNSNNADMGGVVGNGNELDINDVHISSSVSVIVDGEVKGRMYLGGVAGSTSGVDITSTTVGSVNIESKSDVKINAGGYVGHATNKSYISDIDGLTVKIKNEVDTHKKDSLLGGIVGYGEDSTIKEVTLSLSNDNFKTDTSGESKIGGIVGEMSGGEIIDVKVSGLKLDNDKIYYDYAGGLAGKLSGIENIEEVDVSSITIEANPCMEQGKKSKESKIGGVAGEMSSCDTIKKLDVQGIDLLGHDESYAGGIAGSVSGSSFSEITVKSTHVSIKIEEENGSGTAGGVFGDMDSTKISFTKEEGNKDKLVNDFEETVDVSVYTNGTGYIGGVAGEVKGSKSEIKYGKISVDVSDEKEYTSASSPDEDLAIGGLIGKSADSGLKISKIDVSGTVAGTNIAGGLIGIGTFELIGGKDTVDTVYNIASVSAGITPDDKIEEESGGSTPTSLPKLLPTILFAGESGGSDEEKSPYHSSTNPYAGGIIAKMTGGSMNFVENYGSVKAGWNTPLDSYEGTSSSTSGSSEDEEETAEIEGCRLKMEMIEEDRIANGYTAETTGSVESHAGGISAWVSSGTKISNTLNAADVTAKAKISLKVTPSFNKNSSVIDWYTWWYIEHTSYCYYAYQEENAYASGLVYETSETSILKENCQLNASAAVDGGGKIGFNIYKCDTHGFLESFFNMDDVFILDYGVCTDSEYGNKRVYNSFAAFINEDNIISSMGSDIHGGLIAWEKAAEQNAVDFVAVDKSNFIDYWKNYSFSGEAVPSIETLTETRSPGDLDKDGYAEWGQTKTKISLSSGEVNFTTDATGLDTRYGYVLRCANSRINYEDIVDGMVIGGATAEAQLLHYEEKMVQTNVKKKIIDVEEHYITVGEEEEQEQILVPEVSHMAEATITIKYLTVKVETDGGVYYYKLGELEKASSNPDEIPVDDLIVTEKIAEVEAGIKFVEKGLNITCVKYTVQEDTRKRIIPTSDEFFNHIYSYALSNANYGVSKMERVYCWDRISWLSELKDITVDGDFSYARETDVIGNGSFEKGIIGDIDPPTLSNNVSTSSSTPVIPPASLPRR